MPATIEELMERTGVRFGTSGARGLATQLTDFVAHAYTQGFLQYLQEIGELPAGTPVAVAGVLPPNPPPTMGAVRGAGADPRPP
ncbi:MAG TPA: phosphomannomutase, partial [Verrucomicrobiota bacterium]|nr:phosphomannomutase [Verrucomicrobiota bacterium]